MTQPTATPQDRAKKSEWMPRMWQGCDFFTWIRLLARNGFAVEFRYWYIALIDSCATILHTLLGFMQFVVFGWRLRKVELTAPPIFILGHWRTGTTLLHELMICDDRFGYATTYECMDPHHFLLTERWFPRLFWFLMPSKRPMDNMKAGFDRPQEDEFALCMMGAGSPYMTIAFPNHPPQCQEYLDLENVSRAGLNRWKRMFAGFLKRVTYKTRKRLILKSPPHTARIKVLQEMFPGALFIHIVRDPFVVFPSTVNLWKTLYKTHGLQTPKFAGLEEQVLQTFTLMNDRLQEGKRLLEPNQFCELRYEDLTNDPVGEIKKIYEHLQLDGFEQCLPHLKEYLATIKGYETNKYVLTERQRAEIGHRWAEYIHRYGYAQPEPAEPMMATHAR